jgi:ABC-2 type transport system ATP-binding protein
MDIAVQNVCKTYAGVTALGGVSFAIPSGRKVALIGPNGSGKSTLTRIIMGMLTYQGEVLLDGRSPLRYRAELARRLAYVPQNAPQLAASVADVVEAVARIRELEEQPIIEMAARLDLDLPALADRPVRALSAGMKQKLLIALALASRAELLILDEPTASLDAGARAQFFRLFAETAGSATLLLCSHRLEEVQHLVDHVVSLENGRVVFDGPVADFLQDRALCMVEVATASAHQGDWLHRRGFHRASGLSWVKSVTRSEKLHLLREIMTQFNGDLDNLVVRDVETLLDQTTGARS